MDNIIKSGHYHIKPAANHILTVGKGIIKDSYTAILELVKNSYDADAEEVIIKLNFTDDSSNIIISDNGHGMDFETVTQKWMIPSIQSKLKLKRSKDKKRPLQGRKGIGRYSASILGNDLTMKTTDKESLITTELFLNWTDFEGDAFLEDIKVPIKSYKSDNMKGTTLDINGNKVWSDDELGELIKSLSTLISPFGKVGDDFKIFLQIEKENSKYQSYNEEIKSIPILEYYHYRISGTVDFLEKRNNKDVLTANLLIENKSLPNINSIDITKEIILSEGKKFSSLIELDIRAFDLDEPLNENQDIAIEDAKKLLKELPGIAVLRQGFRVRPYGEKKTDWLSLSTRRYNAPTMKLSANQIAGYVTVLQEEESYLEENATREGFKENEYYEGMIDIVLNSLTELEKVRYDFRKQYNKGGRKSETITTTEKIDNLANFDNLKNSIASTLFQANVSEEVKTKITAIIESEEKDKIQKTEEIRKTIAKYEGQITLGKIMTVVLHEGRKSLNAMKRHPGSILEWSKDFTEIFKGNSIFKEKELQDLFEKILDRLKDNKEATELFLAMFKRLEPLANNRKPPKSFSIFTAIKASFKIFEYDLKEKYITYDIKVDTDIEFNGIETDIEIALINLIENSIYWLSNKEKKYIMVVIKANNEKIIIDYQDSGVGINENDIDSQNIFDSGYSTAEGGTGLGLSIAGEVLKRNNGKIRAVSCATGANFVIELNK